MFLVLRLARFWCCSFTADCSRVPSSFSLFPLAPRQQPHRPARQPASDGRPRRPRLLGARASFVFVDTAGRVFSPRPALRHSVARVDTTALPAASIWMDFTYSVADTALLMGMRIGTAEPRRRMPRSSEGSRGSPALDVRDTTQTAI